MDESHAFECLDIFTQDFLSILDAEDKEDGEQIEQILESMREEKTLVKTLRSLLGT